MNRLIQKEIMETNRKMVTWAFAVYLLEATEAAMNARRFSTCGRFTIRFTVIRMLSN